MANRRSFLALLSALAPSTLLSLSGCRQRSGRVASEDSERSASGKFEFPITAGDYTILGIRTDNKDHSLAKANAETTLARYPDVACMVGLWAYNPPACLSAIRAVEKEGEIPVVAFDEHPETLQGISEGTVAGTIVQQPYAFGYRSVEYLAALARGEEVEVPPSRMIFIPHETITAANVQEFQSKIERIKQGEGPELAPARDDYATDRRVRLAFITNSVDPFWRLAEYGAKRAEPIFHAACDVQMPSSGTVEEQKRFVEANITNQLDGMAISPIDPANQGPLINRAAEAMHVICQDSDAPNTRRLFYLGTSNYMAGRAAGRLVREAIPDGGPVMIFVGKLEVLNAQERSRGLIDELSGRPVPPMFADVETDSEPA